MGGNDVLSMVKHYKMETMSFPHHFHGWKWCQFHGLWLEISLETTTFVVPCCFHVISMVSTWTSGQHHMVSNVDTMWFSNGHHVISMLTSHGFHVDTTSLLWFPHDFHRWKCHFHGEILQDGNNIIFTSFLWVETMSFPGINHMFPCIASIAA